MPKIKKKLKHPLKKGKKLRKGNKKGEGPKIRVEKLLA